MSELPRDSQNLPAAEQAAEWFARLQGEGVSADDWAAFAQWLAASPAHHEAYDRVERLWVELDARAPEIAAALDAPRAPRRFASRLSFGVGVAMAVGVAVAVFVAGKPGPSEFYTAAPGQVRAVRLADGTQMRLNAVSTVKVSFRRDARRVELADGEAAFDVTHDPNRPFLIAVGDTEVRVVGTEFDLRHRDGKLSLTVRRGVVEVRPGGSAAPFRVAAGEQLTHQDGAAGVALASVDPDEAFAWSQGQLIYRDAPLSEVAADLSRRFGKPVRLADPQTGQMRFTGVLVTDSESAVLRRLESFSPVKADPSADGGVVLRRTR